ncbi:MAG: hypothetical protein IIB46_05115 [Nitrospinae bacterium]|nr:hypothetical protein [Nitrospinota bacterium]
MFNKKSFTVWVVLLLTLGFAAPKALANNECVPVGEKSVKVEGYISKKFKKNRKAIYKEFAEMGNTRVALRPFPMGDTAKVVAIGRCVPAYIARHVLQTTLKYTNGVESLVTQAFISGHWFGVGLTMFDEPSQQKVSSEQVQQLLDPSLSTEEFQALYRKFSIQDDTVPYFGLRPKNVKKAK